MSKQTQHHHHTKKHTAPKKHQKGKGKHGQGGGGQAMTPGGSSGHGAKGGGPPTKAHTKAKPAKHTKAHKLAIGDAVACCAAEALAATLRLAGQPVTSDQVLELYFYTAADEDAGAPIAVTLAAAAAHGLAGFRPVSFEVCTGARSRTWFPPVLETGRLAVGSPAFLILGAELPGPHALAVDERGGWWSWGRRWDPSAFPAAVLEEAWAVTWS